MNTVKELINAGFVVSVKAYNASHNRVQPKQIFKAMKTMTVSKRAVVAEFVATLLFVYSGTGTACFFSSFPKSSYTNNGSELVELRNDLVIGASFGVITALSFAFAIVVLLYAVSHISGGHMNPCVTLSLWVTGHCGGLQALCNICAQIAGAIGASGLLYATVPNPGSSSLAANVPAPGISNMNVLIGEAIMTSILTFVVHMTAVDPTNRSNVGKFSPLAIGYAVFLAHAVLIPVDGCSINPARSLGPVIVSGNWADGRFWLFVVGPVFGAVVVTPILYFLLAIQWEDERLRGEIGVERTGGMDLKMTANSAGAKIVTADSSSLNV